MNMCTCYHEKMHMLNPTSDPSKEQRAEAQALFGVFITDCTPFLFEWQEGNDDDVYSSPEADTGPVKQSGKADCYSEGNFPTNPETDNCQMFTIIAEVREWTVESTWELESTSANGGDGCFHSMEGPWEVAGDYEVADICLVDGDWKLTGYDSFGDGWNGDGKLLMIDDSGDFKIPPTKVEGAKTDLVFSVSSAACQHSDCFSCVSDTAANGGNGCGYCTADPARSLCVELDSDGEASSCVNPSNGQLVPELLLDSQESCSAGAPTLNITSRTFEHGHLKGGEDIFSLEWDSTNLGGSLAIKIVVFTTHYMCDPLDALCKAEQEEAGNSGKEFVVTPATPNTGEFEWEVSPLITSGTWQLKISTEVPSATGKTVVYSETKPFHVDQPCVEVALIVQAQAWAEEIEFMLYDGRGWFITDCPFLYAHNPGMSFFGWGSNFGLYDYQEYEDSFLVEGEQCLGWSGDDADGDIFVDTHATHFYNEGGPYDCPSDAKTICVPLPDNELCLLPGNYKLDAIDTYGNGWDSVTASGVKGSIKAVYAKTGVTFAGPIFPEADSTKIDIAVVPLDSEDADVDPSVTCGYQPSCGACTDYTFDPDGMYAAQSCGWCLATGKCQSAAGSCPGTYVDGFQCPLMIDVA
jgi:hypothetical protein